MRIFRSLTPDLTDPPGYAMTKALVSVRYPAHEELIILRGRSTESNVAKSISTQYRAHATTLVNDAKFGGISNCWADERIREIAAGSTRGGNRATWAAIVAARHLSFVVDQIVDYWKLNVDE